MPTPEELRRQEFDARQTVVALRRAVFAQGRDEDAPELAAAETKLQRISGERAAAEAQGDAGAGRILGGAGAGKLLGPDTTGLEVTVDLRMASLPTSLVHLFDAQTQPLVAYKIFNNNQATRRLRLVSYVEGYSARAIDTVEIGQLKTVERLQLPTFFPAALAQVDEITRATLNVEVEDLDAKTELHKTIPLWLLARTAAPLQVRDPSTGEWKDMTRYLGAFVTPNAPAIQKYLRSALDKHPLKRLVGYQAGPDEVASQVRAVFEALAAEGVAYVHSVIDFTPEAGTRNQRVRRPSESLEGREANCIDGTVLLASLLEAISLHPALVIIPGHAFVAWETSQDSGVWRHLETTMIADGAFEAACTKADATAKTWQQQAQDLGNPALFKRWPLRDLRAQGIYPLE
jgi:hypothetical protein